MTTPDFTDLDRAWKVNGLELHRALRRTGLIGPLPEELVSRLLEHAGSVHAPPDEGDGHDRETCPYDAVAAGCSCNDDEQAAPSDLYGDHELRAMAVIHAQMEGLAPLARKRVLGWLAHRHDIEIAPC